MIATSSGRRRSEGRVARAHAVMSLPWRGRACTSLTSPHGILGCVGERSSCRESGLWRGQQETRAVRGRAMGGEDRGIAQWFYIFVACQQRLTLQTGR